MQKKVKLRVFGDMHEKGALAFRYIGYQPEDCKKQRLMYQINY